MNRRQFVRLTTAGAVGLAVAPVVSLMPVPRIHVSVVQLARAADAQRQYNFAMSAAVELAALTPKAPWYEERHASSDALC